MKYTWEIKKLKDICEVINGRAYKQSELLNDGKYPVLRVGNFFTNRHWYYSNLELDENKYCTNGDLLYAWSASFGPRIWQGDKVIYHYHIWKMVPDLEAVIKQYLFWYLEWITENLRMNQGVGTTMIHVTKNSIENELIPLPPLPIQKQIVQILDKAFAAIDKAKANIQKNIQNAEELIRGFIDKYLSQMNDDNWISIELSSISKIMYGYTAKARTNGTAKMLRITDIQNNMVNWNAVPFCEISESEFEKYKLLEGDIVFARTGATTGKSYLITKPPKSVFASYLIRVQVDREKIIPNYLYEYFQSSFYWEIINTGISGSAQGGFNASKLNSLQLAIPKDLNVQKEIVTKINNFRMKTILLKSQYSKKIVQLDELKKSLLQKAFSGELTKEADINQQLKQVL